MVKLKQVLRPVYGLQAFVTLVRNPSALEKVFELREALDDPNELSKSIEFLRTLPEGERAFRERPRLGRIDMKKLGAMPEGTLGRAFADHMRAAKLDPDALPTLPSRDEREFVPAHFYETHDIWHVVTGFDVDVAGELGLQAYYLAQYPAPLPILLLATGFLNSLLFQREDTDHRMREIVRGYRLGKISKSLFGMRWNEMWSMPLVEIRRKLGLPDDPRTLDTATALATAA